MPWKLSLQKPITIGEHLTYCSQENATNTASCLKHIYVIEQLIATDTLCPIISLSTLLLLKNTFIIEVRDFMSELP